MSQDMPSQAESRAFPRLKIPAMYTLLRARPAGTDRFIWTGYIYDISLSGMRFELDNPVEPGTKLDVRGMLPGANQITFRATGRVVRYHDEPDEPGPVRMALTFSQFRSDLDELRLSTYLCTSSLRAA